MKTITLLCIALMPFCASAQLEFAPVGATWHYTNDYAMSPAYGYMMVTCVEDSMANGQTYKILEAKETCLRGGRQVVMQQGDSVLLFDKVLDTFQLLYDFGAQAGDAWTVKLSDYGIDTFTFSWHLSIDSTWTDTINGQPLRAMRVDYGNYSSTVVEQLGDLQYLLNFQGSNVYLCDADYPNGLRCYSDSALGYYETGIVDSCTYVYTGVAESRSASFHVAPNPFVDHLQLSLAETAAGVQVLGLDGSLLYAAEANGQRHLHLELGHLPAAVYLVQLTSDGGERTAQRVVKLAE